MSPQAARIHAALPQTQCTRCGFPDCAHYAEAITHAALFTIEGEHDDISGINQTRAAIDLCSGIPDGRKRHMMVEGAGHYGIFSGRRWRGTVYPRVRDFIAEIAGPRGDHPPSPN